MRSFCSNFFTDASPGLLGKGETNYINNSTAVSYNMPINVCKILHYESKMKPYMEAA
jgi:hypothetical protein